MLNKILIGLSFLLLECENDRENRFLNVLVSIVMSVLNIFVHFDQKQIRYFFLNQKLQFIHESKAKKKKHVVFKFYWPDTEIPRI